MKLKKALSLILSLAMALSLLAGIGMFASAEEAALAVYTQEGQTGEAVLVKSYTAAELEAMKTVQTSGYLYYKGDATNAIAATEYVSLDALLSDAGVQFASGDSLQFTCTDGVYTKSTPSYDDIATGQYYYDEAGTAVSVPAGFAISYATGTIEEGTDLAAIAANAQNTGDIRFVYGITEAEYADKSAAGKRSPSGVIAVTVVSRPALAVYTQQGADTTLVAEYTVAELEAMKTAKTSGYLYYKGDAISAIAATEYVSLDALLSDAGIQFASGDCLQFTCTDGVYTKSSPSYDDIAAGQYYYDEAGTAVSVPAGFAISYATGTIEEGTDLAAIAANAQNTGDIRFVYGITEAEYADKSAAGKRSPSGVIAVTVVYGTKEAGEVVASRQSFTVDGKAAAPEAYNIDGSNYVKLRDVAYLLNGTDAQFSVTADGEVKTVTAATGEAYTAVGGECVTGEDKSATCVVSSWTLTVDGETVSCWVYNIGGNNYFKLRDIASALGFGIDFDAETNTAVITSK